jgi:hypothetical protein
LPPFATFWGTGRRCHINRPPEKSTRTPKQMRVFHCENCGHLLFFENSTCVKCDRQLAYVPEATAIATLVPDVGIEWDTTLPGAEGRRFHLCENYHAHQTCNWAVAVDDQQSLCRSCRLTRVIPDPSQIDQRAAWYRLEVAKRRLVFTLFALGLPVDRANGADPGLAFEFKADPADPNAPRVMTGHADGVITINIAEADDAERERRRQSLGEPYRTLVGHMRHESGHYYWDRLIREREDLGDFRTLFGDERQDYAAALRTHYEHGAPPDWSTRSVTAYAASHPWEDWAETWAHYLHIVDTLETAADNGLVLKPRRGDDPQLPRISPRVASRRVSFDHVIDSWFPLTYVLNNLNRGLGLPDGYPFVLSPAAIEKLRFVHDVIGRAAS